MSKIKKIAICVYGVHPLETVRGTTTGNPPISIDYIRKGLLANIYNVNKNCEIYVFLHSWSVEKQNDLLTIFKPTSYIIEPQIKFNKEKYHNVEVYNKIKHPYDMGIGEIFYSHLYSMYKAVQLKTKYEQHQRCHFDCVILSRLDVVWLLPLDITQLNMNNIYHLNFNRTIPERKVETVIDYVFISDSAKINVIGNLYNEISKYNRYDLHAESVKFQHIQQKGWVDKLQSIASDYIRLYRQCRILQTRMPLKTYPHLPKRYRDVIAQRIFAISFTTENNAWLEAEKRLNEIDLKDNL